MKDRHINISTDALVYHQQSEFNEKLWYVFNYHMFIVQLTFYSIELWFQFKRKKLIQLNSVSCVD